jgi:hypothetical protein
MLLDTVKGGSCNNFLCKCYMVLCMYNAKSVKLSHHSSPHSPAIINLFTRTLPALRRFHVITAEKVMIWSSVQAGTGHPIPKKKKCLGFGIGKVYVYDTIIRVYTWLLFSKWIWEFKRERERERENRTVVPVPHVLLLLLLLLLLCCLGGVVGVVLVLYTIYSMDVMQ